MVGSETGGRKVGGSFCRSCWSLLECKVSSSEKEGIHWLHKYRRCCLMRYEMHSPSQEYAKENLNRSPTHLGSLIHVLQCRRSTEKKPDMCVSEGHPIRFCQKIMKRFFACSDCKERTDTVGREYPEHNCRKCGGDHFKPTGMRYAVRVPFDTSLESK